MKSDRKQRVLFGSKSSLFIVFVKCLLFVLFVAFVDYTPKADASNLRHTISPLYGGYNKNTYYEINIWNSMFEDVHVMIFIGFGFLMVFLRKYGYSAVGFNFLVSALIVQWSILCQGLFELNDKYRIEIGIGSLYRADMATATVLISMGAVLGRTDHIQLVLMGILEIVGYCFNNYLNANYLKAVDVGGSVLIHAYGAYCGLAVSYQISRKDRRLDRVDDLEYGQTSSYVSNILALIGTIFLWVYWPSFNAIEMDQDRQHRAIINTYLSLAASCVTTFALSQLLSKEHKINMVHIQNSTLAGGVAIGACAHLMVQPFGAVLIGMVSGVVSVFGFTTVSAFLERKLLVLDTCGVHNLHGMPGLLGGVVAIIMALMANENQYGKTVYQIYSAMAASDVTYSPEYIFTGPGDGRRAGQQAGYQALLIVTTVTIALITGTISGYLVNLRIWNDFTLDLYYEDSVNWDLTDVEQGLIKAPMKWKLRDKLYNFNSDNKLSKISV